MKRRDDWRLCLDSFLTERLRTPFAWGAQDCVLFAADYVHTVTGVDLAHDVRGYTTHRQALRVLSRQGGLTEAVSRRLGPPRNDGGYTEGDVALLRATSGSEGLGVCLAHGVAAPGVHGVVLVELTSVAAYWRF